MCSEHDSELTITVPEWNIAGLNQRITKLNNRATKLDCPQLTVVCSEPRSIPDPGITTAPIPNIVVYDVTIKGECPRIDGYTFYGSLDHVSLPGSTVVKTVPGLNIPTQFFESKPVCDHCGTVRRRNDTFVLKQANGEFIQIGRTCLKDFMGHDPKNVVGYLQSLYKVISELSDEEQMFVGGGKQHWGFDSTEVLLGTMAIIRQHGWKSKSKAVDGETPTADLVIDMFMPSRDPNHKRWLANIRSDMKKNHESDSTTAMDAIKWLDSQETTGEYIHNLKSIRRSKQGVPTNLFGFWCSLIPTYIRAKEREQQNDLKNEYFGKIKNKYTAKVTINHVNQTQGYGGQIMIYTMITDDGYTLTWFSNSSTVTMNLGEQYTIAFTVSSHQEWGPHKQTKVVRVKLVDS